MGDLKRFRIFMPWNVKSRRNHLVDQKNKYTGLDSMKELIQNINKREKLLIISPHFDEQLMF